MLRPRRILLLAFPNGQLLDIAGPLQMFAGANDEQSRQVSRIASVCSGTFFLAAAGVLDGRRAATHWSEVDALKRFRPSVLVDGDAIHVEDGGIWTSAGVTAGMDLALAMIEVDLGREIALAIARRHVVFCIRPGGQSQFSAELAAQSAGNPKLQKLAERVTTHPRADWRIDVLAVEAGVSQRSLSRLFRAGLNLSPADFVERVRIDVARRRLLETDDHVETIALACGFGSLRRMDRAFARTMAASPKEYRSRFKTNGASPRRWELERGHVIVT